MSDTGIDAMPMDDDGEDARARQSAHQAANRPGAVLARHREQLGWTVEQVADQLKMAPRQVAALEADNYAALPGMAIVRGFIRAYAKILRIDAAPLVAMIAVQSSAPTEPDALPSDFSRKIAAAHKPVMGGRERNNWVWIGGGVVVVLLAVAGAQYLGYIPSFDQMAQSAESAAGSETAGDATTVAQALPSGVATPGVATPGVATTAAAPAAPIAAAPAAVTPAATTTAAATLAVPPATTTGATPAAAALAAAAPAGEPGDLVFNVREDTWIQVKLADGTNAISRLLKAGSTESVTIDGPVTVVVGNVAGVDVTLRGQPVAVKSISGNNTARLKLQ